MNGELVGTRPVGRPPGPHDGTLAKILPSAMALLQTDGAAALTPTRLHRETGVARATIYRNWPHPEDLIAVMLDQAADAPDDFTCSGDVVTDLQAAISELRSRLDDGEVRALLTSGLEHGRRSAPVAASTRRFVDRLLQPLRLAASPAVGLATRNDGPVPAGEVSLDDLVGALAGPALLDGLLPGRAVDAERDRALIEHVVTGHGDPAASR